MADGDGAAIDVDLGCVPAEFLVHGAGLCREGFIGFDRDRDRRSSSRPSSVLRARPDGPVPITAGSTPAVAQDAMRASGFKPRASASLALIRTNGGGAVIDARSVGGGDGSVFLEGRA